jgi:hypothetical protein
MEMSHTAMMGPNSLPRVAVPRYWKLERGVNGKHRGLGDPREKNEQDDNCDEDVVALEVVCHYVQALMALRETVPHVTPAAATTACTATHLRIPRRLIGQRSLA